MFFILLQLFLAGRYNHIKSKATYTHKQNMTHTHTHRVSVHGQHTVIFILRIFIRSFNNEISVFSFLNKAVVSWRFLSHPIWQQKWEKERKRVSRRERYRFVCFYFLVSNGKQMVAVIILHLAVPNRIEWKYTRQNLLYLVYLLAQCFILPPLPVCTSDIRWKWQ